ncbi:uncharacterized protein LOC120892322 isoform X4 [Ictidomys tridecemlineatus]
MREKEEQSAVKAKNVDPSLCPQRSPSARVGSDSFQPHMPQNWRACTCAFMCIHTLLKEFKVNKDPGSLWEVNTLGKCVFL